jgi:ATPase subunit of ABC transporter with duplicated ATPase domains
MEIAAAPRAGAIVASMRGAVVRLGTFTLGPVDLQIDWADRVAISGANGSGKTTLLGALLGRIPLTAGQATLGPGVVVGKVDQARGLFLGGEPLLEAFGAAAPEMVAAQIRTLLAKFGLHAVHVLRPAATLSPGERTRAALALLQARGVNLLVLDEPTNHLDLPAIEQLESALESYPGTLLLVTHDRRLLEAVTTNRRISVANGNVTSHLASIHHSCNRLRPRPSHARTYKNHNPERVVASVSGSVAVGSGRWPGGITAYPPSPSHPARNPLGV